MVILKHNSISIRRHGRFRYAFANPGRMMMGVFFARRHLRLALLATLLAAGSAQASSVCLTDSALCDAPPIPAAGRVVGLDVPLETVANVNVDLLPGGDISLGGRAVIPPVSSLSPITWDQFDVGSGGGIIVLRPGNGDSLQRIGVSEWNHGVNRGWTAADALRHVGASANRRDHDYDEFRRHWLRDHDGDHEHHGHDGSGDDDLPKPVPLPGTVFLLGPALLMLRAFQRRNA